MRPPSRHPPRPHRSGRPAGPPVRLIILLALGGAAMTWGGPAAAQPGQWKAEPSALCGRDNALALARQQIEASKTLGDLGQRVAVLIRAADVLWPYQQDRARATFREVFDLAARDFKERGDEPKRVGVAALVETPDQRYVVIRAVARRDPAWARRLAEEVLKADAQEAEGPVARGPRADSRTAEKLLDSALSLLPSDAGAASNFATASLSYPAGPRLTAFLYRLAEVNQRAADQLYERALAVYGDRPVREFLYLTAYPFGFGDTGDTPVSGPYHVPPTFSPDPSLRRRFVQTLVRRARQALLAPADEGDNYNGVPASGHLLQVLDRIAPQVLQSLPDLSGAVEQARNNLLSSLTPEAQSALLPPDPALERPTTVTFDEMVKEAEREPNAARRDELLLAAVMAAAEDEGTDSVAEAAGRIGDSDVRAQVLDWLYFTRARGALEDRRLDEARRLASKVQEMDQRAYLYSEIAGATLQKIETRHQARELLDEIVATADKGPDTVVTVRALLSAAYLYLKIDPSRSISVFGEAVKRINRIKSPDFSETLMRKIEGRNFARYATFNTPGFDLERAFSELAKTDFDNALVLASGLADESLRAQTTLVLADFCLRRAEQQEKAQRPRKTVKP